MSGSRWPKVAAVVVAGAAIGTGIASAAGVLPSSVESMIHEFHSWGLDTTGSATRVAAVTQGTRPTKCGWRRWPAVGNAFTTESWIAMAESRTATRRLRRHAVSCEQLQILVLALPATLGRRSGNRRSDAAGRSSRADRSHQRDIPRRSRPNQMVGSLPHCPAFVTTPPSARSKRWPPTVGSSRRFRCAHSPR